MFGIGDIALTIKKVNKEANEIFDAISYNLSIAPSAIKIRLIGREGYHSVIRIIIQLAANALGNFLALFFLRFLISAIYVVEIRRALKFNTN